MRTSKVMVRDLSQQSASGLWHTVIMSTSPVALALVLAACTTAGSFPAHHAASRPHAAAAATVTCSLLTCSRGKVGQPCSVGNYPGIIVESAPGQLACDPAPATDITITPPPSPAPVVPPPPAPVSTAATLTGTCTLGYFPTGQGAVFIPGPPQGQTISGTYYPPVPAYEMTLANDSGNTADVSGFGVVLYDSNGTELGSDKETVSETFIATGQSLTFTEQAPPPAGVTGFTGTANIRDGSATCDLVTWYGP